MGRVGRRTLLIAAVGILAVGCAAQPEPTPHGDVRLDLRVYDKPAAKAPVYPSYVSAAVRDAYEFAVANPGTLKALPCYCGCGLNAGHHSNLDCFIAGSDADGAVVFDDHGSYCQTCVDIARDAKRLLAEGRSLREVRSEIDVRHGTKGPGTDTPLPNGG